jgi:spore coat polysaccharide biosynthesis predicted glycosyltransferase SpsG/RimJ/RimL family protein N-acetyltransferase
MTFLLLRADASPSTGVGHLSRCVAVASAARARGWEVALCGTFTAGQWLIGDLPVVPTPTPADVLLIDHYELGEVETTSLLVSMEDGPFGRRRADIVVDANLQPTPRPEDGSPVVLRGPAYAPLRPEILAARATRAEDSDPPRVLVVMGGGAAPEAVASAVEALRRTDVPAMVVAISATSIPNVETIPPTPDLPHLLATADLVVSAAGVTLLELCCIGTPTALVQIADNQAAGYNAAVTQGLAAGLGTNPQEHVATLRTLLQNPNKRKALSEKAMTTVDGQGATRIVTAIETALHQGSIGAPGGPPISSLPASTDNSGPRAFAGHSIGASPSESPIGVPGGPPVSTLPVGTDNSPDQLVVRAATKADSGLLLAWRNDSETRAWSRTTDPVSTTDHEAWLASVLNDPDRRLLIVEQSDHPIGTVRFDRGGEHWEVSITVAPEARGRKLAVPMLLAAERTVGPADIKACVHQDNRASLALFRRAGYRQAEQHGDWTWFAKRV